MTCCRAYENTNMFVLDRVFRRTIQLYETDPSTAKRKKIIV